MHAGVAEPAAVRSIRQPMRGSPRSPLGTAGAPGTVGGPPWASRKPDSTRAGPAAEEDSKPSHLRQTGNCAL